MKKFKRKKFYLLIKMINRFLKNASVLYMQCNQMDIEMFVQRHYLLHEAIFLVFHK